MMNLATFAQTFAADALAVQKQYGISAAVVLAVASWESGWGSSKNANVGKNYFGIKLGRTKSPYATGVRPAADGGSYLTYPTVRASFLDFGRVLSVGYPALARISFDTEAFARGFMASGYMTDPKRYTTYYPHLLDNTARFSARLPAPATGLAVGGLLLAGGAVYFTYKYLTTP